MGRTKASVTPKAKRSYTKRKPDTNSSKRSKPESTKEEKIDLSEFDFTIRASARMSDVTVGITNIPGSKNLTSANVSFTSFFARIEEKFDQVSIGKSGDVTIMVFGKSPTSHSFKININEGTGSKPAVLKIFDCFNIKPPKNERIRLHFSLERYYPDNKFVYILSLVNQDSFQPSERPE